MTSNDNQTTPQIYYRPLHKWIEVTLEKNKIGNASSAQPARPSREPAPAVSLTRRVTSATGCVRNANSAASLMMCPSISPSTARWRLRRRTVHETVSLPMT